MKVLFLTLKSKYYDMIEAGIKPEEYREIKKFWIKRLCNSHPGSMGGDLMNKHKVEAYTFKIFDAVHFARGGHFGSSIKQMRFECKGLEIRTGNPDWGAEPGKEYFVIKLGNLINKQ